MPVRAAVALLCLLACALAPAPDARASAVAAGEAQSCAVLGGALSCWGADGSGGLLGTGADLSPNTVADPQPVAGMGAGVTAVDLSSSGGGGATGCALKGGGVFCWGTNGSGQYGNGTKTSGLAPTPMSGMGTGVSEVDISTSHGCALQDGAAKCWGGGGGGRLGDGTALDRLTPVVAKEPNPGTGIDGGGGPGHDMSSGVVDVAAGWRHSCAVKAGDVFCWGDNTNGQLGFGGDDYNYSTPHKYTPRPPVPQPPGDSVEVVAGSDTTCARNTAGAVHCWGSNDAGRLGRGTTGGEDSNAGAVLGLGSGVTALAARGSHLCAIKAGRVLCWGDGQVGKLGTNPPTAHGNDSGTPADVGLAGVTDIAVGGGHTCALAGGAKYCWGTNQSLQLGTDLVESWSGVPVLASGSHPKPPPPPKPPTAPKAPVTVMPPRITPPRALTASILARPSSRLSRQRTAKLATVACPAGATCRTSAPRTVKVTIRKKRFTLTVHGTGTIRAGRKATIGVRLPKAAARRLGRRSVRVKLKLTTTVNGRSTARDLSVIVLGRP